MVVLFQISLPNGPVVIIRTIRSLLMNSRDIASAVTFAAWAFTWAIRIIAVGAAMCVIGAVLFFGTWIAWDLFRWFWWMNPVLGLGSAIGMGWVVYQLGKWTVEGLWWVRQRQGKAELRRMLGTDDA